MKKFTYYLGAIIIMANVFFTTSCSKDDEDVKKSIEVEVSDETATSAVVEWEELDDAFMHEVVVVDEDGDEVLEESFGFDDEGEIVTEIKITGLDKESEYTVTVTAYGLSGDDADELEKILSDLEEATEDGDYDEMMDLYEEMSELLEDADGVLLGDGSATFETADKAEIGEVTGIELTYDGYFTLSWDAFEGTERYKLFINEEEFGAGGISGTATAIVDVEDGDIFKLQAFSDKDMEELIAEGSITYTAPKVVGLTIENTSPASVKVSYEGTYEFISSGGSLKLLDTDEDGAITYKVETSARYGLDLYLDETTYYTSSGDESISFSISKDYFYLKFNPGWDNYNKIVVNEGTVSETNEDATINWADGEAGLGYYKKFSNTQIKFYLSDGSGSIFWNNIPWSNYDATNTVLLLDASLKKSGEIGRVIKTNQINANHKVVVLK